MTSTKAPRGLGTAGRRLWTSVVDRYDPEAHEQLLLEQAARTADLVAELQQRVDQDGPLVGAKMNPAVAEIRQQRIVLARLLVALRMPQTDDEDARPSGQRRGLRGVQQLGGFGAASSA